MTDPDRQERMREVRRPMGKRTACMAWNWKPIQR